MTKEQYLESKESIHKKASSLTKELKVLRDSYIDSNKPCNIGDSVEIINEAGRKIEGIASSFSIGSNQEVYVDAVKENGMVYISKPHKSIKIK